jgi:bifunctional oligoribonuclease and PAP phosphatase NrnA
LSIGNFAGYNSVQKIAFSRSFVIYEDFIAAVGEAKTVFITAHVGPDGDTLGSMLGFKFALEKARPHIQRVDCVISGKMPDAYSFLPGIKDVLRMETATTLLQQYDMAISVDCGSPDRLGLARPFFEGAKVSVNIDHHISNERFGKINVVETTAAASAEVVFDILKEMKIPLDANIATGLYTGIVTDTGGFKYSNTTAKVMETTANLISAGANPEYIFKQLYEEQPLCQIMLQAEALLNTQFNSEKTIGWTVVTRTLLSKHGAMDEHIDGLVESIRRVDSTLIAVVFKETETGITKVSIRSDTHDIDVSAVMAVFGGGGHKMAAGCTMEFSISEAPTKLLPLLEDKVKEKLLVS